MAPSMRQAEIIMKQENAGHKKRYEKLDGIRGLALLNMIAYHAVWDLVYMYQIDWEWYKSYGAYVWQQGICWTFIFLSGFCLPLGRHAVRRGLTVSLCGAAITAATLAVMPQNRVVFGVLTLTGFCMLAAGLCDKWLRKIPPSAGMAVSVLVFVVTRNVNEGGLGFGKWNLCRLPQLLYKNLFTSFLGFPYEDFFSTDYFSLVPWLFLFMAGYFTSLCLGRKNRMGWLVKSAIRPVEWMGKHSLVIYMVHQPVLYVSLEIFMHVY